MEIKAGKCENTFTPEELALLQELDNRAKLSVFRLLMIEELGNYYPLFAMRSVEYKKLENLCKDPYLVCWYSKQAERRCALRDTITEADLPSGLIDEVKLIATQRGRTPLMAEVPENTAFALWRQCGTWRGAMQLAGLELLDDSTLADARYTYGIEHVSPDIIRGRYRDKVAAVEGGWAAIEFVCEYVKKTKRNPQQKHVFGSANHAAFKSVFEQVERGMMILGLTDYVEPIRVAKPKYNPNLSPKEQKTKLKNSITRQKRDARDAAIKAQRSKDRLCFETHMQSVFDRIGLFRYFLIHSADLTIADSINRERVLVYDNVFVFAEKYKISALSDFAGLGIAAQAFRDILQEVASGVRPYLDHYVLLFDERFAACGEYNDSNAQRQILSDFQGTIESYSISLNDLISHTGIRYNNGENTVTYFGVLLF